MGRNLLNVHEVLYHAIFFVVFGIKYHIRKYLICENNNLELQYFSMKNTSHKY
jgi:hypothetical protein